MNHSSKINCWTDKPPAEPVSRNLQTLASAPGVEQIAVMPDIHLSKKLCNGIAVATSGTVFPEAVGGDIGCGYLMADVAGSAKLFRNKRRSQKLLEQISRQVPIIRHSRESMAETLPDDLDQQALSAQQLERLKPRDARVQLGTLGRGNHFVEIQQSQQGSLHVLIHSGSRCVGPAVLAHHIKEAAVCPISKLRFLEIDTPKGDTYWSDMQWARRYAAASRLRMLQLVQNAIGEFHLEVDFDSIVDRDHNHVQREIHDGKPLVVHRKGTQRITPDETGIIPGSMGTPSFLVSGRESIDALESCSHGAGRQMSRKQAAQRISTRDLRSQMHSVHFDEQKTHRLRDEAPAAYKDIRRVMRAQRELIRIEQERMPVLNFKSG